MGIWNRLKKYLLVATIGGTALSTESCDSTSDDASQKNKTNEIVSKSTVDTKKEKPAVVFSPTSLMPYRTDTLDAPISTLLLYTNGSVKRYYVDKNNSYRMQLPYFVHEWWHHHNNLLKYREKYELQPKEYYKLCCHDEITANLAAILTARYEYIEAEDKQAVIDKYKKTYMNFYFYALEKKKVNPLDSSPAARKAEWSFLVNGVRRMWMRLYYPVYSASLKRQLSRFIARVGFSKSQNDNYKMLCSQMYTIGGVDFSKYAVKDIDPNARQVTLINDIRKIESLASSRSGLVNIINANYKYLSDICFEDQKDALQNLLISSKLKLMLKGVSESDLKRNPQIVTACYEKIWHDLKGDQAYENLINEYCGEFSMSMEKSDRELSKIYKDNVAKMYFHNNTDLTLLIEDFSAHRLPLQTKLFDDGKSAVFYSSATEPLDINFIIGRIDEIKKYSKLFPASMVKSEQKKERVSDMQYIEIPNFFEPILVSSTSDQQQQIYQAIKNFNEIPEVLKNCDTQAQIEYQKSQYRIQKQLSRHKRRKTKRELVATRRSVARTQ